MRKRMTALALSVGAVGAAVAVRDYRRWTALGEGGIPWGLRGWLKVTRLRLLQGDPLDMSGLSNGSEHPLIRSLPVRSGQRPTIAPHPIPHRELGLDVSPGMLGQLDQLLHEELASRPGIEVKESQFEKHHPALFSASLAERKHSPTGEVIHYHRPQGSLHVHLNPTDAKAVVERGWGELHGLSGRVVPATYALLYGPRHDDDLEGIRRIASATLDWATEVSDRGKNRA